MRGNVWETNVWETGNLDLTSSCNNNIINQYENRRNSLHQSPGVD